MVVVSLNPPRARAAVSSLATRLLLCAAALGGGAATARYTDIARCNAHGLGPRPGAQSQESRPRQEAQGSARALTASTSGAAPVLLSAVMAEAPASDAEDDPAPHDALGASLARGAIMTGSTPQRLILFTFDDGPDRATTPLLLDRLDAAGVRAVFFLTGANLVGENAAQRRNQQIARETVARGHFVASHGMNHRQLPLLSDLEVSSEVVQTEQIFERVLGARPWLIRPPGGAHSPRVDKLLAARGYTTMLWNLGAGDFQVRTAKEVHETWRKVFERREAEGERGGIVLLHDTYAWSVDAFQLIMRDLLDRNCALLESDQELYDFVDDPSIFFAPRDDQDVSAVAKPAMLDPTRHELRQAALREETRQRCSTLAAY
ncbi:MAG: polysaccharide deacetylase family protein [Myxococcales bacterium]